MAKRHRKENHLLAEAEALVTDQEDRREATIVRSLMGSVTFLVSDEELIEPLDIEPEPHPPGTG
jgi:hypothetical protein